jgi:3-oxoacyl-[acyl-carrier-protein] synthase-1
MRELPDALNFPTGQIPWKIPESTFRASGDMANTRIIRIIDFALEQIRPIIEKAIARYGPEKIGVCLGSCDNGSEASLKAHSELFATGIFPQGYELRFQGASFPAEFIAAKFGISGPVMTIATACASGASAIVRGAELIQAGICSAVIVGGADIVSETVLMGFHALEALSDSLTNPFSKNRKGINLGEGAAFFLLTSQEMPSPIELIGVGESADAYHMTGPGPDGAGPVKAMKAALLDAGMEPKQIGYVNLHGTGTQLNDLTEALAMKAVFGDTMPPASSTKPIMGHTLGVAGALEAAVCWMVLTERKGLPVHCWDGIQDEELVFHPFIPSGQMSGQTPSICMSNNFAFGGCNVSLILGRR